MIVDGDAHAPCYQEFNGRLKLLLVVVRIDPELLKVWPREAGNFKPHQRNMGGEWQVPIEEGREVRKMRYRELVQDNPNFDRLLVTRQLRSEEHTSELQSRQYLVCRL